MFLRIWSSIDAHKPLIFEVVSICLGDHIMWIYGETDQSGDIVLAECNCSKHTAFFNSCYRHDPTVFLLVKHECRKRRRIKVCLLMPPTVSLPPLHLVHRTNIGC